MTAGALLLLAVLGALSAGAVMGTVTTTLGLEERVAIGVVAAFVFDAAACFLLSLAIGFGAAAILLAPAAVAAVAVLAGVLRGRSPVGPWRASWCRSRAAPRTGLAMAAVTAVAAVCFGLLFSRAMFQDANGALVTGYWIPDWANHLITAASFSVSHNVPPQDPLMSGSPLYYPFLPDFTAAMLMRLGLGDGPSLWVPQVILGTTLVILTVGFAARLGAHRSVGVIAVVICFLGGGLGFIGALGDACSSAGSTAEQCSAAYVLSHPAEGLAVTAGTLRALPGIVANQPRQYDGMTTAPAAGTPVFRNSQGQSLQDWYSPLFAWWLPQRTILEGFDTVVAVLILVGAALDGPVAPRWDVALAGLLAGLLPFIHVQSLFALGVICVGLAALRWRPAWLLFAGATIVVALPRTLELLAAPHGSALTGNQYPWFEPGWMSGIYASGVLPGGLGGVLAGAGEVVRTPFTGAFWWFWIINLGIAVPLTVGVTLWIAGRRTWIWLVERRVPELPAASPEGVADSMAGSRTSSLQAAALPTARRLAATAGPASPPHLAGVAAATLGDVPTATSGDGESGSPGEREGGSGGRASVASRWPVRLGLSAPLLRFFLATVPIFVLANIVVFQSWDWDNTKLFVYWYLGVALLVAAISVRLWVGVGRRALSVLLVGSMIATGALEVARLIPHTPPCSAAEARTSTCPPATSPLLGPYTLASAQDGQLASEIEARTAPDAVFLIPDSSTAWDDPATLLTGRPAVMGWTGWLWSYGFDYGPRQQAVGVAYQGCGSAPIAGCPSILTVLRRYDVSYVEVNSAVPPSGAGWWAAQRLHVTASSSSAVIYDVRSLTR